MVTFKSIPKTILISLILNLNMKCSKCGNKIEETFLGKMKGTFIDKQPVCQECQKKEEKEGKPQ